MKKLVGFIILVGFIFLLAPIPAQAANITVTYNGNQVVFTDQVPFINADNRTMVPVRAPMEAVGASVSWNDTTRQATITKDSKIALFTIGSKQYSVNGTAQQMDTTAQIAGSRTVFPIRFVMEAFGKYVHWDSYSNTVKILDQKPQPMTSLTAEAKVRLMAYPYPKVAEIYSRMVEYKNECIEQGGTESYKQDSMQSVLNQKSLIKSNQKFFFDSDLCYACTGNYGERVRGILQTTKSDGSVIEQDVEFGFAFGTHFVSDGEIPQSSHWLEGNDFIELNSPVYL
ncbi:MAG: copper amine oxidase N-terminal domain-containing protein [Parabacteroides sp.]|nr:copper amine oxidase N-terminal domain-containing protein [Parabacteroides sp.]